MKKIILSILVTICFIVTATAQTVQNRSVRPMSERRMERQIERRRIRRMERRHHRRRHHVSEINPTATQRSQAVLLYKAEVTSAI